MLNAGGPVVHFIMLVSVIKNLIEKSEINANPYSEQAALKLNVINMKSIKNLINKKNQCNLHL
jgi:hypothetical protein